MHSVSHFTKLYYWGCLLLVLGCDALSGCQSPPAKETMPATSDSAPSAAGLPSPNRPPEAAAPQPASIPTPKDLQFKTLQNPDGTWGYDILGDGKLLLHQPHIPALPGNAGFATAAQATRVAQAAIQKIKNGESLPTLSVEEVQGLMAN